ncbi:hypothetical protein N0B31_09460 [Salinirubellus salinus]|uniref:Uncharacterized protein n=1 Tax=Salinirubellus salinus TaxID=1364945 RepID=A0A9E7R727_9EURY|nr:hypothetical protein [Salinirubellus salinus]UWM56503.1 hypothetical protein N0B31_09460 [Salinirubellus salinus]
MDTNSIERALNATLNGAATGAAVYLLGRATGYQHPRVAATLVGTAVGVGTYSAMAHVDFEAIAEAAAAAEAEVEAAVEETDVVDVPVDAPDEESADEPHRRRRTEVLSSAVEHAMGFRGGEEEPSA